MRTPLPLTFLILPFLSTLTSTQNDRTTSVIEAATVTIIDTTITTYISSVTTTPDPSYTDSLTLRTALLNSTNYFRHQHNASYLAWNESLASYASEYAAQCEWAHSRGPPGENLARGYVDAGAAVDAWGREREMYNFGRDGGDGGITGFTEETGHFTQLVWKSTQTVGCAVEACNGRNGIAGYYLVCEYWPPGNIQGTGRERNVFFEQNVERQVVEGDEGYDTFSATAGATGVNGAQATGTLVPTVEVGNGVARIGMNMQEGAGGWLIAVAIAVLKYL